MKLNLGCAKNHLDGFINIDIDRDCLPDLVLDLGNEKLPFEDNSVDMVVSNHFLEHLSMDETVHLIKEIYRVCRVGATISFCCPHYLSPVAYMIGHKQRIGENYFQGWEDMFDISYKMSFMRYRPKRKGMLRILPFLGIIPCNIIFTLVKKEKRIK